MRTDPSFSTNSDDFTSDADDIVDHQEELNSSHEPDEQSEESQHLSDYRQRYGLSIDPFADDQHFPLYTGGQRRQILDQLLHLCQFSNNLLIVLGSYSVGKTRMAQALIDALDDADDICFLEGQITSTFDSLMTGVLDQFELPDIETFTEFVKRQSDTDGLAVLIIDNAHHLTDDVLLQLINLMSSGQDTRVHIVFFAESHLLPRIQDLNIGNIVLSDFQLIKFSLAETVDYLNFRMEMADYLGPEVFTESMVEPWWRQSRGQLLELHECAQDKLLASTASSSSPPRRHVNYGKKTLPVPHMVGAAALGAVLIMGLIYWSGDSSSSHKEPPKLAAIPASKPLEQSQSVTVSQAAVSAPSVAQTSIAANAAPTSPPIETNEEPVKSAAPAATTTTAAVANVAASSAAQVQSVPVPASQVVKENVIPLVKTNSLPASELPTKVSSASAVKEVKKVEVPPEKVEKIEKEKVVAKKIEAQVVSPPPASVPTKSVPETVGYSEQEKTLLSWSESDFTLQLVGLSSEKAARDFIAQQPNRKDLLLFKSLRQGKDWFVVVTGRYPSSASARQAAQQLPESQKKATPWSRDLKTIQKEIKSR